MTDNSYKNSGVDIDAGNALVRRIATATRTTRRPEALDTLGGFGGLFAIPAGYHAPVLVSGTDGVGTKLKLAQTLNRHDTIGIDLVAMCVNDVLTYGAEPLYFLDYFACGRLDVDVAEHVILGMVAGCKQAGCTLLGGETAEMPGMYESGVYDLAGFAVAVVEQARIIDGQRIRPGDQLIGLASSGVHANGFSLVRAIVDANDYDTPLANGETLANALLKPTIIYASTILNLIRQLPENTLKGLVHITGGGLLENIPRILPAHCNAQLNATAWPRPPIFSWLAHHGNLAPSEMQRVFNCGIGYVIVVAEADCQTTLDQLANSTDIQAYHIGDVTQGDTDDRVVINNWC